MTEITSITRAEPRRLCGLRKPGGLYAVSPGAAAIGGYTVNCDLAVLDRPVPLPLTLGSRRGYIYVDGTAILARLSPASWRISPDDALAAATAWRRWGMPFQERVSTGVCTGIAGNGHTNPVAAIADRLAALTPLVDRWQESAEYLRDYIQAIRHHTHAECKLVPAISAAHSLVSLSTGGQASASDLLAAIWRLASAVRWYTDADEELCLRLSSALIACGAIPDAAYLRDGWDRRYNPLRPVPDLLDWVGKSHYPTDGAFVTEAHALGVSRRLASFPRAACPGITRVFLAHPHCADAGGKPAVFGYYYLSEIHYIVARQDEPVPADLLAAGVVPVLPVVPASIPCETGEGDRRHRTGEDQ